MADAFSDFTDTFGGTDGDILAGLKRTGTYRGAGIDWVKSGQIAHAFGYAGGRAARAFSNASGYGTDAAPYLGRCRSQSERREENEYLHIPLGFSIA